MTDHEYDTTGEYGDGEETNGGWEEPGEGGMEGMEAGKSGAGKGRAGKEGAGKEGGGGREVWPSRTSFVLAAMGSAVGLGNVWRFPYYCYKFGGGAFLIPYFVALFTTGIPIMILEYSCGHKFRTSAPVAFARIHRKWGWVGWFALLMSLIVMLYYMVIMAWSLMYMFKSFDLAWGDNTSDHFLNDFLNLSNGPGDLHLGAWNWEIVFGLAIIWGIVYLIIFRGVESVSKVVMLTVPLPFVLLIILAIKGATLDGSTDGLEYYLKPDLSRIGEVDIWLAAYGQIFFTLSLAQGVMIAYSSYLPRKADIANNAYLVSFMDIGTSFLAGFAVFSVIGYLAYTQDAAVSEVVQEGGAGLAFVVYPAAINQMGWWAKPVGILFFITLLTLGIDSGFAMVEAFVAGMKDIGMDPKKVLAGTISFGFVGGLVFTTPGGLYWLDIIDHFLNDFGLISVGILECLILGHLFGAEKLVEHSNRVSERRIGTGWYYSVKYLTPMILVAILFVKLTEIGDGYGGYPGWALWIGALMLPVALVCSLYLAGKTNDMLDGEWNGETEDGDGEDGNRGGGVEGQEGIEWTD